MNHVMISPDTSRACRTQSESHIPSFCKKVFRSYPNWNFMLLQINLAVERLDSRVLVVAI